MSCIRKFACIYAKLLLQKVVFTKILEILLPVWFIERLLFELLKGGCVGVIPDLCGNTTTLWKEVLFNNNYNERFISRI